MPFLKTETVSSIEDFIQKSGFKNHEELLIRNYLLMQLSNVDISGRAREKIINLVEGDLNRLVKYKMHRMFLEDKVNQAIRNPDVWLQDTFNKLDMVINNASN